MKKEKDKRELDEVYSKYKKSVNMTYSQMKKWAENPLSRKASLTRGPVKRNLHLLETLKSKWGRKEIRWAKKTIAFNSRMKKVAKGKPLSKDIPLSKRDISLRNWAWNPNKNVGF
ncbi:MAG: hypothetical protein WDZ77_03245 [Candidatus Pacearchaeota archaeon]